jgi:phage N-6-adenine-methyltransferase
MANDLWATPQYIFDWLNSEFNFLLDAACNLDNAKCVFGCCHDRDQDGLTMDWASYGRVWLNPPYSKPYPWVKKAYEESLKGGTVVCLLPADISTKWFHEWVIGKAEIRFIQGRINFDNPTPGKYSAPKFGSMIAVYGPNVTPRVISVKRPDKPRKTF